MLKINIVNSADNTSVNFKKTMAGQALIVKQPEKIVGVFKSVTRSATGTTIITEPKENHAINLTDLIISTDKVQAATVTIQFTDDTNTIIIFSTDVSDAPANIAIPFAGKWRGWKNARLELVTVNAVTATAALGYYHVDPEFSLSFEEWDAIR